MTFITFTTLQRSLIPCRKHFVVGFSRSLGTSTAQHRNPNGLGEDTVGTLCKEARLKKALSILYDGGGGISSVYGFLLQHWAKFRAIAEGKLVHSHMIKTGFEPDTIVRNHLINMYSKCGNFTDARQIFDNMPERNLISWTAMISGYEQHGLGEEALGVFCQMVNAGMKSNEFTLASAIAACAGSVALERGKQVHGHSIVIGLESNIFVSNTLITMYAKCDKLVDARQKFDKMPDPNVVSWTAVIAGLVQHGHCEKALLLFCRMQEEGVKSNPYTFASVLSTCSSMGALKQGKQVHAYVIKAGIKSNVFVGNALVTMYAECGNIENAKYLFDRMSEPDVVSWNAMIGGNVQHGQYDEALNLFCQIGREGMKLNQFSITSGLRACASMAALEQGKQVHAHIIKSGLDSGVFVGSALVDMYAKSGNVEDAHQQFNKMPIRNVVSWNAMISGCAQHGYGQDAIQLFEQMQLENVKPDCITFVGVLSACNHVGMVDAGRNYFSSMSSVYGIKTEGYHYACMVDILGRAGHLDEAVNFINQMPFEPDGAVLGSLLAACRIHGNIKLGKQVAEHLFYLEPQNVTNHVLLSNIYAADCRWDDVAKVRKIMKDRGLKKEPGRSWIEVRNRVHSFLAGDRSHPKSEDIYSMLDKLAEKMEAAGYVPDTKFVLNNVEEVHSKNLCRTTTNRTHLDSGNLSESLRTFECVVTDKMLLSSSVTFSDEKLF